MPEIINRSIGLIISRIERIKKEKGKKTSPEEQYSFIRHEGKT